MILLRSRNDMRDDRLEVPFTVHAFIHSLRIKQTRKTQLCVKSITSHRFCSLVARSQIAHPSTDSPRDPAVAAGLACKQMHETMLSIKANELSDSPLKLPPGFNLTLQTRSTISSFKHRVKCWRFETGRLRHRA